MKYTKKIKLSDCLILPSVEEGIANVVLEAMALGTPVISSNCGGMNEIIRNKENGYLFQKRNPKYLSKVMEDVIFLDKDQRMSIINNAAKKDIYKKS
ncbi:MAG: glycosyltransferase [Candidatus Neomarinimicrobiota bacterium]